MNPFGAERIRLVAEIKDVPEQIDFGGAPGAFFEGLLEADRRPAVGRVGRGIAPEADFDGLGHAPFLCRMKGRDYHRKYR